MHTDVCGPIKPMSTGQNRYYLTFIDDFSRKTWIYFLKRKSEVFNCFKEFKAIVEKQSGYKIRTVRSDQGGNIQQMTLKPSVHNKASDIKQRLFIHHS